MNSRLRYLSCFTAAVACAVASPVLAQSITFDIPAQSVSSAVREAARQANVQIVVSGSVAQGHRSKAVSGQMSIEQALTKMLENTGLVVSNTAPNTFVVVNVKVAAVDPDPIQDAREIIVTGRAGTGTRTKAETSYSITRINEEALRLQGASSVTEALKSVPGFWVEASGGEASGNVRARGVPVDGFGSINLLEDGVPLQHDPALGYLNADQVFRLDETIDRIEVVRGGPSSVFYSNAPAGAVNFIPRTVGDNAEGLIKTEIGADQLYRTDFWLGAPVGDWKMSVGGFYRSETGVRDPGYTGNLGGQIRATIERDLDKGHFSVDVKEMDDKVIFYTNIPFYHDTSGKLLPVPGFDGNSGTLAGPETEVEDMKTANGSTYHYDNTEGTHVKRTQITGKFDYEIADGFKLKSTVRYSDTNTQRNGFFANSVASAASFISSKASLLNGVTGATALQLRYVDNGSAFSTASQNGNGDVIQAGLRALTLPVKEFIADNQMSHRFEFGGMTHDVTVGYYFAHTDEQFNRYSSLYLTDVENNARLLNLVAVDANGNLVTTLTDNGALRYGYEWANAKGEQTTNALYLADEWQITPKLRLDGGLRWENVSTEGTVENSMSVNLGTLATSNILTGNGTFGQYNAHFSKVAWTVGGNYQFSSNFGTFARYTFAYRLPGLANYVTSATASPIIQTTNLGEAGVKFAQHDVQIYATAFWTQYNDVGFTNYVFDPVTFTAKTQSLYANTSTIGLELDGKWRPIRYFDISASATIENPKYENYIYTDATNTQYNFDGHQLIRVPKVSVRVVPGVNLFNDRLRFQAAVEYEGKRFVDAANSVILPSYVSVNLSARVEATKRLTFYGYVDNATNSLGLTEGNPRAGEVSSTDAGANAFLTRPLLGRNYRLAAMFRF